MTVAVTLPVAREWVVSVSHLKRLISHQFRYDCCQEASDVVFVPTLQLALEVFLEGS